MPIPIAYLAVVLVWSTTPLAVFYSNDSFSPIAAVNGRMLLALLISALITLALGYKKFEVQKHWRVYAASSLGLFPNMPLVYTAANYIPSGLISVLFALSPFMVALLLAKLGKGDKASKRQWLCLFAALLGLLLVTESQLQADSDAWIGIVLMIGSCLCFSLSNVFIKFFSKPDESINPANQLTGSLLFAVPGLVITWFFMDGQIPEVSQTSLLATLYLAIIGSVIGFVAYFYLLKHISALSVSVIPLLTPAFALMLGAWVNDESLTERMILGTAVISLSLAFFNDEMADKILALSTYKKCFIKLFDVAKASNK